MNSTTKKLQAVPSVPSRPMGDVATLASVLSSYFPERGSVIRAMLTGAVAGEHTVMLGPPGTAKSLLARTMAKGFASSYFELLMTRFTTPEEVMGPVKLSGLQQDRFTRAFAGYLPSAEVVFLDEVFKANSAILNALLTALNERVFHDDGKPMAIPLVTCIAASNELPEGPELDALYDRFLVRVVTDYVADRVAFRDMLTGGGPGIVPHVDIRAEQAAACKVRTLDDTIDAIVDLRYACRGAGIAVSDRRWRQSLGLIRAAAHVDGRDLAEPDDLEILEHVLWRKPDERVSIARVIQTTINPSGAKAVEELDAARELLARLPVAGTVDRGAYMGAIAGAVQDVGQILKRLEALPVGRKVTAAVAEVTRIKSDVARLAMRAAGVEL